MEESSPDTVNDSNIYRNFFVLEEFAANVKTKTIDLCSKLNETL
jgi:hypothetical protein